MDPLTSGILCGILLLFHFGIGVSIGLSFILSGFVVSLLLLGVAASLSLLGEAAYSAIARPSWAAIPLFILMGCFCARGGLARMAYLGTYALARKLPGALMIATCLSCGLFGAISGSSVATTALFGRIALPEMLRFNYDSALSAGCIAAAGTFASMIPPSILLIIYAMFTHQSVAELFAAGIIPALLTVTAYCLTIFVLVRRKPSLAPARDPTEILGADISRRRAVMGMWPIFIIAGIVLVGLYGGFFTPTEAAAVGTIASLVVAFGLRPNAWQTTLISSMRESARITAMLFLLVIGALYFSRVAAITGFPQEIARTVTSWALPPFAVLLAVMLIVFILGMFMVPVGVFALTLPIMLPVLLELGYDPVWFGVIMLKLTEIGAVTPPVGLNIFAMKAACPPSARLGLGDISRGCAIFIIVDLCILAALVAFPNLALWLPSLL